MILDSEHSERFTMMCTFSTLFPDILLPNMLNKYNELISDNIIITLRFIFCHHLFSSVIFGQKKKIIKQNNELELYYHMIGVQSR